MRAPDICLEGNRVMIRPLTRKDLRVMSNWPRFQDPLYRLFDWPKRSKTSDDLWFQQLMRSKARVYYAVDNENHELIGRISLREIDGRKSARLGIGFGPNFVDRGYGTEALQMFLTYFFLDLGFERMVLDVAAVNQRALRCYRRCGFRSVASHYQYAGHDEDLSFLRKKHYRHLQHFFKKDRYRTTMLAYDMELKRRDWVTHQQAWNLSENPLKPPHPDASSALGDRNAHPQGCEN